MFPQHPLSNRIRLWSTILTLLSLEDLALTIIALRGVPAARELNPLASLAFHHGLFIAMAFKLLGIGIAVCVAAYLARRGFENRVHKTLVAWSAFYLILNGVSAFYLVGGL